MGSRDVETGGSVERKGGAEWQMVTSLESRDVETGGPSEEFSVTTQRPI